MPTKTNKSASRMASGSGSNLLSRKTGFSRTRLGLIASALGAVGIVAIVFSHASTAAKVACTSIGSGKYNCSFITPTPIRYGNNASAGTFNSSTNWVKCQLTGAKVTRGAYYNIYWGYTESDQGHWGWVNAVYAKSGGNNGAYGGGVPACSQNVHYNGSSAPGYPPRSTTASACPSTPPRFTLFVYGGQACAARAYSAGHFALSSVINNGLTKWTDTITFTSGGDLVFTEGGKRKWHTNTSGSSDTLGFQKDGNVVIYSAHGTVLWSSHTNLGYGSGDPEFYEFNLEEIGVEIFAGTNASGSNDHLIWSAP